MGYRIYWLNPVSGETHASRDEHFLGWNSVIVRSGAKSTIVDGGFDGLQSTEIVGTRSVWKTHDPVAGPPLMKTAFF
jgi:hypothetical protein